MPKGYYIRTAYHRMRSSLGMKGNKNSLGTKHSLEFRLKNSEAHKGAKHYAWKGGITPINQHIRKSLEYRLWREAVFERDDYRCLDCGERGSRLNADHIYPFALFPRLRLDIYNGQTLCVDCHKRTPTFAGRTRSQQTVKSQSDQVLAKVKTQK